MPRRRTFSIRPQKLRRDCGVRDALQHLQGGCLPRSVGAQEAETATFGYLEADAVHSAHPRIDLDQVARFDEGRHKGDHTDSLEIRISFTALDEMSREAPPFWDPLSGWRWIRSETDFSIGMLIWARKAINPRLLMRS